MPGLRLHPSEMTNPFMDLIIAAAIPIGRLELRLCKSMALEPALMRCEMARMYCADDSGQSMVNYLVLHYYGMGGAKWVLVLVLVTVLILAF